MGYRSVVVLAVGKKARPHLMHFLGKYPSAMTLAFKHHDEKVENFQDEEGSIMFMWDSIKWYEGYDEIEAFTEFMNHMDGEDIEDDDGQDSSNGEEHYRFVRVGEDADDIEDRGCAFYIHPRTSIEY